MTILPPSFRGDNQDSVTSEPAPCSVIKPCGASGVSAIIRSERWLGYAVCKLGVVSIIADRSPLIVARNSELKMFPFASKIRKNFLI